MRTSIVGLSQGKEFAVEDFTDLQDARAIGVVALPYSERKRPGTRHLDHGAEEQGANGVVGFDTWEDFGARLASSRAAPRHSES
jgi:hypothetical protein